MRNSGVLLVVAMVAACISWLPAFADPGSPAQTMPAAAITANSKLGDASTNSIGMTLVFIPKGAFEMGSPKDEAGRYENETQHHVELTKPFAMETTPVTQGQWKQIMGTTVRDLMGAKKWYVPGEGDNNPVYFVTWDEANEFCRKLSEKEGKHYRLPTEAEWEYACRAGSTGAFGGTGVLEEMGWFAGNSGDAPFDPQVIADTTDRSHYGSLIAARGCKTHPVAQKKPNAWGLYDMNGNVSNWCADWFDNYPTGSSTDPQGPAQGKVRVYRGGAWSKIARDCRSAHRNSTTPDHRIHIGFRVVMDL